MAEKSKTPLAIRPTTDCDLFPKRSRSVLVIHNVIFFAAIETFDRNLYGNFRKICHKALNKFQRWTEKHAAMLFGGYKLRLQMRVKCDTIVEIVPYLTLTRKTILLLINLNAWLQVELLTHLLNFLKTSDPPPWREAEATYRVNRRVDLEDTKFRQLAA